MARLIDITSQNLSVYLYRLLKNPILIYVLIVNKNCGVRNSACVKIIGCKSEWKLLNITLKGNSI